jgi:hypothetical protein
MVCFSKKISSPYGVLIFLVEACPKPMLALAMIRRFVAFTTQPREAPAETISTMKLPFTSARMSKDRTLL